MQVICHSDDQSVVADLKSHSTRHKGIMHLIRCVAFAEAQLRCSLYPMYIDTKASHVVDSQWRNNRSIFFLKRYISSPLAEPGVSPLPVGSMETDWISQTWCKFFRGIFRLA